MNKIGLILVFLFQLSYAQVSDFKDINFAIADNTAKLYEGESLTNLPVLVHKLTAKLPTQVEKFRAIYSWICFNIRGDINQNNKIDRKRKKYKTDSLSYSLWIEAYKRTAFKKLLKRKKTMCTGYAYLLKEMCALANIECKIINGYGRTAETNIDTLNLLNHSWNAVKLKNKWYLCDATWSSGYSDSYNVFIKDYNDGYFLTDPILFAESHYPINKKWLLDSTLMNSNFVPTPLPYSETYKHKIIPLSPNTMQVEVCKNDEVHFRIKSLKRINTNAISLILFLGNNQKTLKIYNIKQQNGIIQFKHKFAIKGFYDVHIKVNDDIVLTYTIQVT